MKYDDFNIVTRLRDRLEMLVNKIFGSNSSYLNRLKAISFSPSIAFSGMPDSISINAYNAGRNSFLSLVDTMIEDLQISGIETSEGSNVMIDFPQNLSDHIFVIHGHNEEMKQAVARVLEQLSLKPIILHEQANKGRTIIEKFTDHSNVSFAIALLSADDIGYSINDKPEHAKLRARQNVIFELGFFLGKLGRHKVVALFETNDNFEFPSDYQGVIFIPFDKGGRWKFDLLRELKACNYNLDANKLL
jgi:predicted nucleotide-binding protein